MRKLIPFLAVIVCASCLLFPYLAKGQSEDGWSSMNPLSIPLKVRQEFYKKGNLVRNASFERAEIGLNDSLIYNFKLPYWQVTGNHVQLTDITNKNYKNSDADQGIHAIKIVRTSQDVGDVINPPEGVLSDYISVIPGNYNFDFDIRLEKIIPSSYPDRFQRRIGKDIDIRLQFYDENKKLLDPGMYFEYVGKKIDNSFKGFAFSNYFYINKFNWARVSGRTWAYPFSEGDVPDKCRYVRIFLGLKCSGTLWVDNIDFHLSRWNFTPLERMDSFFNKKYDLTDLLIPEPQSIAHKQHILLKNKLVSLSCEKTIIPQDHPAIRLLREKLAGIRDCVVRVNQPVAKKQASRELRIIWVKGGQQPLREPNLSAEFEAIKDKEQGYFIRKEGNRIYLGANQPAGWYYAACTLAQLIDTDNATLDYADITDYPDFTGRSALLFAYQNRWSLEQHRSLSDSAIQTKLDSRYVQLRQQLKDIDFYASYKLNDLYSPYFNLSKRWWDPGSFYKTYFDTIGTYCSRNYHDIMHLAAQFNPYFHIDMEQREDTLSDSLREIFSHGREESFDKIIHVLKPALDAGARTVMLCADDYVPHAGIIRGEYTLFNRSDKRRFTNLASAQAYLLNKLQLWLNKHYGQVCLEFVPPAYNNWFIDYGRGTAQAYFQDLTSHLDSSVVLVWTGNVIRSLSYDMADIQRVETLYKRKPMIWDNSPYARALESPNGGYPANYPLKSVMCDLFEPLDIQYPVQFPSYLDSHYYSNNGGTGEINKIKNMTFADFVWNTKSYNPDFSLFKALVHYTNEKEGRSLLLFNEVYFRLVTSCAALNAKTKHDPEYKPDQERLQAANNEIKELHRVFDSLSLIKNDGLKEELRNTMNSRIDEWNKLAGITLNQ